VTNGTTAGVAAVPLTVLDSAGTDPSDGISVSRLNEHAAAVDDTRHQTPQLVKPSAVETKTPSDVPPQHSVVVAPALSHSAKVELSRLVLSVINTSSSQ